MYVLVRACTCWWACTGVGGRVGGLVQACTGVGGRVHGVGVLVGLY